MLALGGCAGAAFQPMGEAVSPPALTEHALVTADRLPLPLRRWLPAEGEPSAVIVALHGFNDYSNAFEMPGRWWAEQGIATYAYDQRGFGQAGRPGIWATTDTLVADLYGAVAAARKEHPGVPLYVLGESMGGAVAMTALAEPPPGHVPLARQIDGAILSAPAIWGYNSLNPLYRFVLWLGTNTVPWMKLQPPPDLKIVPSDNIEMLRALSRDPLIIKETRVDAVAGLVNLMSRAENAVRNPPPVPVLMMYGRNEQVIPPDVIGRALRSLSDDPRRTLAIYDEGYHMLLRDLQAETVWRDVLSWVRDPSAPLPSGADRAPWDIKGHRAPERRLAVRGDR